MKKKNFEFADIYTPFIIRVFKLLSVKDILSLYHIFTFFETLDYSLVSHGTDTVGQNECWGTYDDTTNTGWGPGYQYACIHSGSNDYSGGDTVWYNYAIASAGTITNKDAADTTGNIITTTESVCPKGWTLPSQKQIDNNRSISDFLPILGGVFINGNASNVNTRGNWWGNEAYNNLRRYRLLYNATNLLTNNDSPYIGLYIRCVSEEKAITSLTYMQDMTPAIVAATPEGTTATLNQH